MSFAIAALLALATSIVEFHVYLNIIYQIYPVYCDKYLSVMFLWSFLVLQHDNLYLLMLQEEKLKTTVI